MTPTEKEKELLTQLLADRKDIRKSLLAICEDYKPIGKHAPKEDSKPIKPK